MKVCWKVMLHNTKADHQRIGKAFVETDMELITSSCLDLSWNRSSIWIIFKAERIQIEDISDLLGIDTSKIEYQSPTFFSDRGKIVPLYNSVEDQEKGIYTEEYCNHLLKKKEC